MANEQDVRRQFEDLLNSTYRETLQRGIPFDIGLTDPSQFPTVDPFWDSHDFLSQIAWNTGFDEAHHLGTFFNN